MKNGIVVLAASLVLSFAGVAAADDTAALAALGGSWTVAKRTTEGKDAPAEVCKSLIFTVTGDKYVLTQNGTQAEAGSI